MKMFRQISRIALTALIAACYNGVAMAADKDAVLDGNMIGNPSFEFDWHNNHAEGHILAFRADWSFNSSDGNPDYWRPGGPYKYVKGVAHTGSRSLLLKGGSSVSRSVALGVMSGKRSGGWGGTAVIPLKYDKPVKAARTITAQIWYKSPGLGGGNTLELTLKSFGLTKTVKANGPATAWTRLACIITRKEIEQAFAGGKAKGLPTAQTLTVKVKGTAAVHVDDISLAEDTSSDINLAANSSFEIFDKKTGYPKGWSLLKKYTWMPAQYYKWTDWHHSMRTGRGPVAGSDIAAHSGSRSLLMQVYPGDEWLLEGDPVVLKQTDRGVIEIGVFVLADRVKWLDIRALDESGNDIRGVPGFQGRWLVPVDTGQLYPSNARRWVYIRKLFQGKKPIKSIRPQLCARGFNGDTRDDGGTRSNVCQTGIVWWDDVRVIERSATTAEIKARVRPPKASKGRPGVVVTGVDLGERLFGVNKARFDIHNNSKKTAKIVVKLAVSPGSAGAEAPSKVETVKVRVKAGQTVAVTVPYTINVLDGHWLRQGRMVLSLVNGKKERTVSLAYNTWPVVVDFDFSKHYATPAENPQNLAINLGVAADTLARTKKLVLEIRRERDDKVVQTIALGDAMKAIARTAATYKDFANDFGVPGPVYWKGKLGVSKMVVHADLKNLVAVKLDLGKLPVHPADHPVRDHYLRLRGLDAKGKEVFADNSQAFGRVKQINERLPKITKTEVRKDGAVLINGKPVFIMAGNAYMSGRYGLSLSQIKKYGHNAVRWVENEKAVRANWAANLYSLETMTKYLGGALTPAKMKEAFGPRLKKWAADGTLDGVITLAIYYEHGAAAFTREQIEAQKVYTQLCNKSGRFSNFGAGGAHGLYSVESVLDAYDSFGLEIEPMGPPRGGLELAAVLRKGGKAWFHLPQTYDPTPFDQFRFDWYLTIVQGGRGVSTIHGLGDPSFMRGLTGEIRYLSPAIFSMDKGDKRTRVSPNLFWMQRRNKRKTTIIACSKPPVEIGKWRWREGEAASGKRAHTGSSEFSARPMPDGLRLHGLRELKPVMIEKGDVIVQHVWLDPKADPSTVSWGVRGDARWDFNGYWGKKFDFKKWRNESINHWFAGELLPGTWQMYWAYDQRTKNWFADNVMSPNTFKVSGKKPAKGEWVKLKMKAGELGLVGKQVDGMFFLSKDGEAWWDRTAIVRGDKEIVLCDDTAGHARDELANVKFSVPWAKDGTRVKVLFEERELVVKDGSFVDDFRGVDTYLGVRGGAVADAIGWHALGTKLLAQTLGYVTPNAPVEVHIYEIK